MAYYFTVEKKKGEFSPLDITKSSCFTRMSNLKGSGSTLQEIDTFTTMFFDEDELRQFLINDGILPIECFNKGLSIRNLKKGVYHKVMYDFLYQKDIEYICNPQKIINKINNKLLSGDFRFVLKFAKHYAEYHECSSTAPEVRMYASESIKLNMQYHHFNDLDENNDNPLVRMTKLLIYDYYQNPSGRVEYKPTIKYRNLHSVIAFVNYYDKKYEEESKKEDSQISLFQDASKTKKRSRKHEQIPGQISLFDK